MVEAVEMAAMVEMVPAVGGRRDKLDAPYLVAGERGGDGGGYGDGSHGGDGAGCGRVTRIMDPTSSLERICLGENVYASPSEKVEGHRDWDAPKYTDTAGSKEKNVTKALRFYKMETDEEVKLCLDYEVKKGNKVVKKEVIVALKGELYFVNFIINPKKDNVEPEVILRRHLTQEEAAKEALTLGISLKFPLLEDVRPVLEIMSYNEKYKKVLDEIWKDKVGLDGMIVKEEEEAINKVKGEALKEKDDLGAFIFPIRFEGKINENALADTGSNIITMPYRIYEQLGRKIKMSTEGSQ
nr:hypothetical protein [Tanacetum cinerariifolium]